MPTPTVPPTDDCPDRDLTPEELEADEREWEARLTRLAVEASTANPPRRFAICDDYPETDDEIVIAYGLATDTGALAWRGHGVLFTESAERALRFYSRIADARLVWLDPAEEPVERPEPVRLPAFSGRLQRDVNLDDSAALLDLMEGHDLEP